MRNGCCWRCRRPDCRSRSIPSERSAARLRGKAEVLFEPDTAKSWRQCRSLGRRLAKQSHRVRNERAAGSGLCPTDTAPDRDWIEGSNEACKGGVFGRKLVMVEKLTREWNSTIVRQWLLTRIVAARSDQVVAEKGGRDR